MRGLVAVGVLLPIACVQERPFRCDSSAQCSIGEARGVCQTGYCAYPDLDCESEYRYEANAGDGLAGKCVGVDDEADACDVFCALWIDLCNDAYAVYAGTESCYSACIQWPEEGENPDSLECRRDRLDEVVLLEDPDNCVDATPSGGTTCSPEDVPTCDTFCEAFYSYPTCDASGGYESPDECRSVCLGFRPAGEGNTIQCRQGLLDLVAEAIERDEPVDPDWCVDAGAEPVTGPCVDAQ